MSGIDIALCIIIALGGFSGYRQGFLMSLFSLLAIVLGVLGGFKLLGMAMVFLAEEFNVDEKILPYVAFAVVFIGIVIAVRLVGNMIKLSIDKSFFGQIDQVAGLLLGILKTAFMLSVLLWIADSLRLSLPEKWTNNSWILPKIAVFAPAVTSWIGELFPVFKNIF